MSKNIRYVIYTAIIVVCFVSVILAIFDAIFLNEDTSNYVVPPLASNSQTQEEEIPEIEETMDVRVTNFKNSFKNEVFIGNYDTSAIEKTDESKDIVYTAAKVEDETELYNVNINIPLININNSVIQSFNMNTQEIFVEQANKVMQNSSVKTIYTVDYVGYVNGDILSLVIMSTIKEGEKAQQVIVQTYNYNLKTKKAVTAEEILTSLQYDIATVNDQIKREIEQVSEDAAILQQSGYESYTRNPEDKQYLVENAKTYYLGENGALFMIYAYGNNDLTSEIDIIRFD